ncbi:hypothetical protein [Streptomyces sp. WAC01280]|uniref:hypothetical protein n=1 Tax=Streptomyces sp. WAC01280 TaxID=2487424 RepID=UPI000F76E2D7|nr:hypothetical protein [Streptomyces sp. WAC01280]RSS53235.1 hypothetical protein EF909_27440 [Streptomyces sp. WAC01280]
MADNLVGKSQQDGIPGVYGGNDVNGNGVVGETNGTGFGVFGQSKAGVGVVGKSFVSKAAGVYGGNDSDGPGVTGETNGLGTGVFGQSKKGHGVTGRAWEPALSGVHGFFNDNPGDPPTPTEGHFTTGVRGTVCLHGQPGTDSQQRKQAAGVLGEVGPGAGFGHGVMGLGIEDEGVFGWSERSAGGSFVGLSGPGVTATSNKRGQIQLVPRDVSFGADPQGNPRPKLPKFAKSGELTMVTKDGKCSLWLCVKSWQAGGGVVPQTDARWAEVKLGAAFNGETP